MTVECRCRSGAAALTPARRSPFAVIEDLPGKEGFRPAPGRIVVAAEADIAIEHDFPRLHVDDVEFRLLYQRAHLVKAADQQMGGTGLLRFAQQLTVMDVAHRASV